MFKRSPTLVYLLLTFLISWGGTIAVALPKLSRGEAFNEADGYLMGILMLAGPFIAGVVMSFVSNGKAGLRKLWVGMNPRHLPTRWCTSILLFPVILSGTAALLSMLLSSEFAPIFLAPGLAMGLVVGIMEETGWTGFVTPQYLQRYSPLKAAILLGIIHGIWHIVPDFIVQSPKLDGWWIYYFIGFFVFVIALRIFMIWAYLHTKSLLLGILLHASSTGFFIVLISTDLTPVYQVIFYGSYAVILLSVVGLIVRRDWHRLMQSPDIRTIAQ